MKPNATNAKYAILFIWIVLALDIVSFASSYMLYDSLKAAQAGVPITVEAEEAQDIRESLIAILYLIAFITSAVFFLRWFKTAYHNLGQKMDTRRTAGWAIGSWFIPIGNLFIPYQIMKEIYARTREFLIARDCEIGRTLTSDYLGWWWALLIFSGFVGQVALRLSLKAKELPELIMAARVDMADSIISIPLALITIKVIKDYDRIEPVLQQIDNQPPSLPTPA